jgi:LPS O-antigen subunit length determinant protein (WzzB/FepE family)
MAGLWADSAVLSRNAHDSTMTNKLPHDVPQDVRATAPYYAEDEIDLVDLWLLLARRKRLFLSVFGAVVVATAVLIAAVPRVYESRAVLQIGSVGSLGVLEPHPVLVERLIQEYRVNDTRVERPYPRVDSVSAKKEQGDIVTIVAHGRTQESAREFLDKVVAEIGARHEKILAENTELMRQRLAVLTERVKQSRELLDTLGHTAESIKSSDSRNVTILLQEKTGLARELPQVETDLGTVRASLLSSQTYPTRSLRDPTAVDKPVRPRPALYGALGVVIGGMLGLFAVFLASFREKLRERRALLGDKS